jgi:hypothetical protein
MYKMWIFSGNFDAAAISGEAASSMYFLKNVSTSPRFPRRLSRLILLIANIIRPGTLFSKVANTSNAASKFPENYFKLELYKSLKGFAGFSTLVSSKAIS